jgi:hypothetical protein
MRLLAAPNAAAVTLHCELNNTLLTKPTALMRTIVIPTDFTNEGIQVAETIIRDIDADQVRVIFTHLFHVADDIQDLLFSTYREKEYELVSGQFWRDCRSLKDAFSKKLTSIKIEFFYGNKLASLKNFLENCETDFIAYSAQYGIPKLSKSSLDALPVLKKSGYMLVDTDKIGVNALTDVEGYR